MDCFNYRFLDLIHLDEQQFQSIRESVPIYGVICLKNQSLAIEDLVEFTNRMGNPVLLPEALRFNNTQQRYPEVARVSNILTDGTLLENHAAAEYWHSDGDFWQPGDNYIFNFLYSEIVPASGGATAFADLRLAYRSLDKHTQNAIDKLTVVVSCDEIPDFKDIAPKDRQPDARHKVKHHHPETGETGLYFGHTLARIDGIPENESTDIISQFTAAIEKQENHYVHEWEKGDLLIWDNTSVMHRSMGGYGTSPRLLYRTQAFMQPEFSRYKKLMNPNTLSKSIEMSMQD